MTLAIGARAVTAAALMMAMMAQTGCAGIGRALGVEKSSPDEFAIVTKAPLVIPPDYSLRPPAAQTRGPAASDAELIAQRALIGDRNYLTPTMSAGEKVLVTKAGAQYADPMIRTVIDQEFADVVRKDESIANRLLFWNGADTGNKSVDAAAEKARLEEEAAKGGADAPPAGQETPTIEKDKPNLLGGLF